MIATTDSARESSVQRIQQSASIILKADIATVFPLFGPVREMDWAYGWSPKIIFGEGEVEEHMIFETEGPGEKYTWAITQYAPEKYTIEYTVSASQRIWFITVQCQPFDTQTRATVRYRYTGFTSQANEKNRKALSKMFEHHLKDWESAINYYLISGTQLVNP